MLHYEEGRSYPITAYRLHYYHVLQKEALQLPFSELRGLQQVRRDIERGNPTPKVDRTGKFLIDPLSCWIILPHLKKRKSDE